MCFASRNTDNIVIEHRLQWWLENIDWEKNRTDKEGAGVKIAIIDTGVDVSHIDFRNNVGQNIRVTNLENEDIGDTSHGTAVAGIIGAYPSHNKGLLGIAPGATILPIDVTDGNTVEMWNLIEGIYIAIENKVDIISISIGLKEDSQELHNVIQKAYNQGIVIVASAGNYMEGEILYPAKYDEVIAVGAVNRQGEVISPQGELEKEVVYLPGKNVVTTIGNNDYAGVDGTSFSAAILSGVIAVIMEKQPGVTQNEIYSFFRENTDNITVEECIKGLAGGGYNESENIDMSYKFFDKFFCATCSFSG